MDTKRVRNWNLVTLVVILFLALAIRLVAINFGMPYVYYTDEARIVNHAVAFGTGDLNPHAFDHPSLYMYASFFFYGLSFVFGWVLGIFESTADYAQLFFRDPTLFYLISRLISALSGVASVVVVYLLGRRIFNVKVGLISAAFLTFAVFHVEFSHYVKTHVPAGFLVIVGLWLAWRIYEGNDRWRDYVFAGLVAGLAASTIYHAGSVLVSVGVAHIIRWYESLKKPVKVSLFSPKIFASGLASVVGLIIGTPYAVLDWSTFIADLTSSVSDYYLAGEFWARGLLYPFTSLLLTMGLPLGVLSLLGLGYALLRRRPGDLVLLSQPLFLGCFLMLFATKEPQHMLIAFPALVLLGASMIDDLIIRLFPPYFQRVGLIVVTVLILIVPATISIQNIYRLTLQDTRDLAKDWTETNVPPGSKIVMDSGKYYLSALGPSLQMSRWTLEQLIGRADALERDSLARREGTRRVGYEREGEFFQQQLQALDDELISYDIVQILHDMGSPKADVLTLDEYLTMNVQYAIVNDDVYERYFRDGEENTLFQEKAALYRNYYQEMESRAVLLEVFDPSEKITGPSLRIYQLP